MNEHDNQLHRLLQQWPEIDPPADFAAQVWHRLREPARPSFADWLRAWLPQPVFATAAAVVIGIVIGASSGFSSVRPATGQLQFPYPDSLTGNYLELVRR
jgi:hypothetical protein